MIQQGTSEWKAQRVSKVTGSRAGAILGVSPLHTRDDIMREMVREYHGVYSEFEGNIATHYGNSNEDNAIFELEMEHDINVEKTGFHAHPHYDWLGASPDGLVGDKDVVEIKCPYGLRDDKEPVFKTIKEQPHYYAQVQIEMSCSDRCICIFYQWSRHGSIVEHVYRDSDWLDKNVPILKEFHDEYLKVISDPELCEPYLEDLVNVIPEHSLADIYIDAKIKLEEAQEILNEAKAALIKLADGKKTRVGGILVYPIVKRGSVSYAKAVKDKLGDIDLEEYRGKPSTIWGVK